MDPTLVESIRILKRFFDDIYRKLANSVDDTLVCLSLEHVLCLYSGLKLFYEHEDQPYDNECITDADQSKFFYELRCLYNYAVGLKHLKLVPGNVSRFESRSRMDVGDLNGLRTLEINKIPCEMFCGFDVLCSDLQQLTCRRCGVPSIKTVLFSLRRTQSKRCSSDVFSPQWSGLKVLKLPNNKITSIDDSINLALNLEVVDLSYNEIKSADVSLQGLVKLESLLLNKNSLTSLVGLVSTTMSNLSQLSLSFNLLQSLDGVEGLVNLRELDVSDNLIMFVERCDQLKSLRKLQKLEVAGNPFCLSKKYSLAVLLKLHPAVIDNIILDGKKFSRKEKNLFVSTLDSPANPIPHVTSHDSTTPFVVSSNKKKPRIISNIPDQTNFQDDDDFLLSSSFKERGEMMSRLSADEIVEHFQSVHRNFDVDMQRRGQKVMEKGRKAAVESPGRNVRESVASEPRPVVQSSTPNNRRIVDKAEPRLSGGSLVDGSANSCRMKVQAVVENEPSMKKDQYAIEEEEPSKPTIEELYSTVNKDQSSSTGTSSFYFDVDQFKGSSSIPSTDNSLYFLTKSHPTLLASDLSPLPSPSGSEFRSFRTTCDDDRRSSGCATSTPSTPKGRSFVLDHPYLFGVTAEEQEHLFRDLTDEDVKFDVVLLSATPRQPLSCVIRENWLIIAERDSLPNLRVEETFDLRALKKVTQSELNRGDLKLEFDSLQRQKRGRLISMVGGEAARKEFVQLLSQFLKVPDNKMLECIKCGFTFEEEDQPSSLHSSELQLKTKMALATQREQNKQVCPQCSSPMVVRATRKQTDNQKVDRGSFGMNRVLSMISKQLPTTDFSPIENILNRSMTAEMGFVDPKDSSPRQGTPELSSSGSFQIRRNPCSDQQMSRRQAMFIERGIIGDDEDVKYYVDEEGQEAV